MSDLAKRLLASIQMGAVLHGDSRERMVCERQMAEAARVLGEQQAKIDRLRAENERLRAEALIHERGRAEDARDHHGDMAVLRAENERLRQDAERYRCARQNGILVIDVRGKSSSAVFPEEWDALIDAVRLGKERVSDE